MSRKPDLTQQHIGPIQIIAKTIFLPTNHHPQHTQLKSKSIKQLHPTPTNKKEMCTRADIYNIPY